MGVVGLALGLRLVRALCRWDEVSWLYAAYPSATVQSVADGQIGQALVTWVGLHPPAFALLHTAQELVLPVPLLFLLTSVAASLGAVWLLARRAPMAGLVLATSPLQLHYAAEINDYPLVVLLVAGAWAARARAQERGRWGALAVVLTAAAWTHPLAAAAALLALPGLPLAVAARVLGVAAFCAVPLLPPAYAALMEPGTYRQPPFELGLVFADFRDRFGLIGFLWAVPAAWAARRQPALAGALLGSLALIALLVGLGIAAPHQFPYFLVLGPPLALLVARAVSDRPPQMVGAVALALLQGGVVLSHDLTRLRDMAVDVQAGGRAIDHALAEAGPEDALYLLSVAGINDDDKRATSAVLWRLPPWRSMPIVLRAGLDPADHRQGQPRRVDGRIVYLSDHVYPAIQDAVAAHEVLWVVVSQPGRRAEYTTELAALLGSQPERIGPDHLYRLAR